MRALTLRNIPPELARFIRQKASKERLSLNKAVIRLLEECTGSPGRKKEKRLYHDLDTLAGSWTKREAGEFEQVLRRQRAIDEDLWK